MTCQGQSRGMARSKYPNICQCTSKRSREFESSSARGVSAPARPVSTQGHRDCRQHEGGPGPGHCSQPGAAPPKLEALAGMVTAGTAAAREPGVFVTKDETKQNRVVGEIESKKQKFLLKK